MQDLKQLMIDYELTANDIARLLGRKKNTVEGWLSVGQTRPMPEHMMKLLMLKLKSP